MSDLVQRLRFGQQTPLQAIQLMIKAADRIEVLERVIREIWAGIVPGIHYWAFRCCAVQPWR
jgi:hypothetical protein